MKVLIIKPGEEPYEEDIKHSLEGMQEIVGGPIQAVYPYADPVAIVCNDEGKLEGLPLNRVLKDKQGKVYDVIVGTFFIAGLSDDDFTDLPPELMKKYKEKFKYPEKFILRRNA